MSPSTTTIHVLVLQSTCSFTSASVGPVLGPEIQYLDQAIVIRMRVIPMLDAATCQHEFRVVTPTLIELPEPIGDRSIEDGSVDPPAVRWRMAPQAAFVLPANRMEPFSIGVAIETGFCAGVGIDAVVAGSPDDPRLVWLAGRRRPGKGTALSWPPGYSVKFGNGFEVLNEAGEVVHRLGDRIDGACVSANESLSLYGDGYIVLD
jgi:hypothetical protein